MEINKNLLALDPENPPPNPPLLYPENNINIISN